MVAYNIPRELPRTLHSLSPAYQRDVTADDYEVVVVDNGSNPPVDAAAVAAFGPNFRLIRIEDASPSPAAAVNLGIRSARGNAIGVMIDGARLVTPGLINFARTGIAMTETAIVVAPGWYLGSDLQGHAATIGYTSEIEDSLLESIDWPADGYRLFEISTMDESSIDGWFHVIAEANALFMRRDTWRALGGMDEGFKLPGGGLVNLDILERAMRLPEAKMVMLLGEATFHQLHGGVSTNATIEQQASNWWEWKADRDRLRGPGEFQWHKPSLFVGSIPASFMPHLTRGAVSTTPGVSRHAEATVLAQILCADDPIPEDETLAKLFMLARSCFADGRYNTAAQILRLASARAPAEGNSSRTLSVATTLAQRRGDWAAEAAHFTALGDAHAILGDAAAATQHYRRALEIGPDTPQAHVGLANLRMSGPFYYEWLERFYTGFAPAIVIEIGVFTGKSLAKVKPPTLAIGIDPTPRAMSILSTQTHLFAETSDAFFARGGADTLLAGRKVGIGFIDGLHTFDQVLRDFANLERLCGPGSMLLIHDTAALDEATQRVPPVTGFHTGDVWKVVPALKALRPDLDVFTIATPWTGLTVACGFAEIARSDRSWIAVAMERFGKLDFRDVEATLAEAIELVPNDWDGVVARLRARGVDGARAIRPMEKNVP